MTSYRCTKNNVFNTQALHIFVNEISSPTFTTQIFVLYHIILCSFFLWYYNQPDDGHYGRNM